VATISKASLNDADINWATITNLSAAVATIVSGQIANAEIDYAKVKDLVAGTAIITEGIGGKLLIERLAVTEANIVSLSVGALMIKGEDGRFYRLIADGSGGVTTEVVPVEGINIADDSIPAGKIIEQSITARELNVTEIFADDALIGAVKAANIDVNDLTASAAFIRALTSARIEGEDGSLEFVVSNSEINRYLRFTAGEAIELGESGGRFKTRILSGSYVIQRDGVTAFKIDDSGAEGDIFRAKKQMQVGNGAALDYNEDDGVSILLL